MIMKCLKVKEPWASKIVLRLKVWEIRRQKTFIRGKIAIGCEGKVIGYAELADCWCMKVEDLKKFNHFHMANDFLDVYANGKTHLFVWHFQKVEAERNPYPYSYSTGSWCNTDVPLEFAPGLNIGLQSDSYGKKVGEN
jgi:hypothetical protein